MISDESRVDLLDCPVVRDPMSLAFARSNATSGLDVLAVVGSMWATAGVESKLDECWLEQIGGLEAVTSCGSKIE